MKQKQMFGYVRLNRHPDATDDRAAMKDFA
jgi:hypothetical protein